jgi:iron complex transport system substrate-binding protein
MKLSALLLAGLLAIGAALAAPITVTDGLRRSVTVNVPAKRIVALSLTAAEVMLDVGIAPVGRPSSATHPAEVLRVPEVGSAYSPDVERILAQRPDLLLGSVGTTAARARDLGALRVPLVVTADSSLKDVYDTYTLVGRLTGQPEQAALALKLLQSRVNRTIAQVPRNAARPKVLALLSAGGQSFSTTDETYIGDLLEKLQVVNVAKGTPSPDPRQPGFVALSLEQIVAANPDVILAFRPRTASGDFAPSPLAQLETQPAFRNLNAVKNNRVHLLDADPFVSAPGPRAAESLAALLPLLYPKK